MQILRRKDIYNQEAGELLAVAEQPGQPARWYGRGCGAAGFAPGSVIYPYYLLPLAGLIGAQDVTCAPSPDGPADAAQMAAALEASDPGPAPNIGDGWVIATFTHNAWQCAQWPSPHVHCAILMDTPAGVRKAWREYGEAYAQNWVAGGAFQPLPRSPSQPRRKGQTAARSSSAARVRWKTRPLENGTARSGGS